MYIFRWG